MRSLGDAMALGCAVVWALAVLLFRRLSGVGAVSLNLFKNALATALLLLTMLALGLRFDLHRAPLDWLALCASGVLGLAVADTLFLAGLRRIDASVAAVADCAYSPAVMVFAALWLGESPRVGLALGAPLVVAGLALVGYEPRAAAVKVDRVGLALAVSGVMTTALGVVIAKRALDRSGLIEATTVRLVAGSLALFAAQVARGRGREALVLFKPQPSWRVAVPATVLATYVSMILWLGGMKYGTASRAAVLNQTGAVFVLLFSRLAGEPVPPRRMIGVAIALAGVMVVLRA